MTMTWRGRAESSLNTSPVVATKLELSTLLLFSHGRKEAEVEGDQKKTDRYEWNDEYDGQQAVKKMHNESLDLRVSYICQLHDDFAMFLSVEYNYGLYGHILIEFNRGRRNFKKAVENLLIQFWF